MAGSGKTMGYTHKGRQWEYQQSWYMLLLFTPWTYWIPLVYTGLRTMQFRWIVYGLCYGLPAFVQMAFDPGSFEVFFKRWVFAALVVAAIHAFQARGEYLVRLSNNLESHDILMEGARLLKEGVAEAAGIDIEEDEQPRQATEPRPTAEPVVPKPARRLFDINKIGERELAMLPGMGPERARQALAMRDTLGGFNSFDHFAEKMGLSADAKERLSPIFIQPEAVEQSNAEYTEAPDGRRMLEINVVSAQAIATLPGMDHEIARRAVSLRDADGPFKSIEDFRYRLGLSMEVFIQISPIVSTLKTPATPTGNAKPSGRVVDASSASTVDPASASKPSGRIVDL